MLADIERLLQLQSIDLRAAALEQEIAQLPKHVAQIEKTLESHLRRLEADQAALAANQKNRKKLDGDVQVHQQKISKLRDQMLQAKTNDQYRAFQHEITWCEDEIRKCEDQILDFMSASEPLEAAVKAAEVSLKQEKAQVESEKKVARERTTADQAALAVIKQERAAVAAAVAPALVQSYDRIRKKFNGVAVADATSGRCGACQIVLRPQYFQDLKKSEKVQLCESCGRILYYNPPQSFEATG